MKQPGVQLRRATIQDVDQMHLIFNQASHSCDQHYSVDQLQAIAKYNDPAELERRIQQCHTIVAYVDDVIVGYGVLNEDNCRILALFVDARYQGYGIGKTLIQYFENKAAADSYTSLKLQSRLNAVAFYQKMGFSVLEEVQQQVDGITVPFVQMVKQLA